MKTDSIFLQQAKAHPDHQYWSEINRDDTPTPTPSDADVLTTPPDPTQDTESGHNLIDSIISFLYDNPIITYIIYAVIGCLIVFVIYMVIKDMTPGFDEDSDSTDMGDDTIYGHDWEKETKGHMERGAYSEVVVLCYLRWLDRLNDDGVIVFSQSKTPGMFVKEIERFLSNPKPDETPDPNLLAKTQTLTHHYLRIRYGHKPASEQLAKEMLTL